MSSLPPIDDRHNPYLATASTAVDDLHPGSVRPQSTGSPFVSVWLHPRRTYASLASGAKSLPMIPVVCLYGIADSLSRASDRNVGDQIALPAILGIILLVGPLGGLLTWVLSSFLIRWTGKWIGGRGQSSDIRQAAALGSIPRIASLPIWAIIIAVAGREAFTSESPTLDAEPWRALVLGLGLILVGGLALWGFIVLCNTIAEAQGFTSAWKGFGNIVLSGLVLLLPIIVLVGISLLLAAV